MDNASFLAISFPHIPQHFYNETSEETRQALRLEEVRLALVTQSLTLNELFEINQIGCLALQNDTLRALKFSVRERVTLTYQASMLLQRKAIQIQLAEGKLFKKDLLSISSLAYNLYNASYLATWIDKEPSLWQMFIPLTETLYTLLSNTTLTQALEKERIHPKYIAKLDILSQQFLASNLVLSALQQHTTSLRTLVKLLQASQISSAQHVRIYRDNPAAYLFAQAIEEQSRIQHIKHSLLNKDYTIKN